MLQPVVDAAAFGDLLMHPAHPTGHGGCSALDIAPVQAHGGPRAETEGAKSGRPCRAATVSSRLRPASGSVRVEVSMGEGDRRAVDAARAPPRPGCSC